ncbi:hypothetical protein SEA_SLOOPYJOE_33 [Arthrobacter phage Sloopyjoe]|nr:hypothetical protein PBI_EGAD_33 [Arthrobacter phage Egad]QFG12630.1 hypothetical protein PBI_MICHELLE_33 [Arthrobacter phage Michelle]QFG14403.1 hypothetical protein PBI_STARLORD_33 [Arthrobacter phage StarLord]WAB09449.1 hypothetical protein SEA_SLOOPYJOE_33 [Arthrobacter phage Sloopyjoe]WKW85751.1 hypothetical protein SEA_MRAARONIAN_33 [Arthrobacter phage MrAaronian]WNO27638.1 hypothetical protein SEA_DJUNGELSKOG_33 [Arthrobacter phage Djungelskog]
MDKYESIEELYARKSEINLRIVTLEEKIARSADYTQNRVDLQELADLHYKEFMIQYEIKAVLDAPKPNILTKLFTRI